MRVTAYPSAAAKGQPRKVEMAVVKMANWGAWWYHAPIDNSVIYLHNHTITTTIIMQIKYMYQHFTYMPLL